MTIMYARSQLAMIGTTKETATKISRRFVDR